MGRNGCQIFWSAHLITAGQSDPQARSPDDDVVHADTSALVDELRPGLVQNHSGFVIKSGGPTMTPHLAVNDAAPWRNVQRMGSKNPVFACSFMTSPMSRGSRCRHWQDGKRAKKSPQGAG